MAKVEIIYEDADILVCHKPAGLATETARVGQPDVVSQLKNELSRRQTKSDARLPYLGVVHRLDQPVEGLLVFGRTKKAAAALSAQLGSGALNKRYRAVVCGRLSPGEGEMVNYLYKGAGNSAVVVTKEQAAQNKAKKAVLYYSVEREKHVGEGTFHGDESLSLVDIRIDTGRFHQIRAQMAHAGHPLLGDQKYGDERSQELSRRLEVRSVALCAYELKFLHPVKGTACRFHVEPAGRIFGIFGDFPS